MGSDWPAGPGTGAEVESGVSAAAGLADAASPAGNRHIVGDHQDTSKAIWPNPSLLVPAQL